ncbi:MAG: topoisomerase [Betaproteobacteria bacterium]|nr:topoisomerase [Betaproteobacteria bacterium]
MTFVSTQAPAARIADAPRNVSEELRVAREAGLSYVSDAKPGIKRVGTPGRFRYLDKDGKSVRDSAVLDRIRALVIPPAWADVWICSSVNGHLQATGRDARGRKQYRYHPKWRETRDANKFDQMKAFVHALPAIRKKVDSDLRLPGLPREKILAVVVRLLETTLIRVGNERYARENGSYGLTTMRNRHVRIRGERLQFDFRGKSGQKHHIELADKRLAAIVRRCRELPGHELFQYLDEDGEKRIVTSTDVNEYLSSITAGCAYTAKDFRTWAGTVLAALALQGREPPAAETHAKKSIADAVRAVAQKLGNTPAICRKCYVHPGVIEAYRQGRLAALPATAPEALSPPSLSRRQELTLTRLLAQAARQRARSTPLKPKPKPGAKPASR